MGTWAGVSALALAVGPVLGGFLTEHVSWRAIFYLNIPVAIGAVAGRAVRGARVARHDASAARSTTLGVAALTAALTALILALVEGNSWGWGSTEIVALLVGAVVGAGRLRRGRAAGQGADGRVQAASATATSSAPSWSR